MQHKVRVPFFFLVFSLVALMAAALPQKASANSWGVGNTVGLCSGAEIRTGSGLSYSVHTVVPENGWAVVVIGGPRYADGHTWWDVSRAATGDGSGGTGWVIQGQNGDCPVSSDGNNGGGGDNGGGNNGGDGDPCGRQREIREFTGGAGWSGELPEYPKFETVWKIPGARAESAIQYAAGAEGWFCDNEYRITTNLLTEFSIEDSKNRSISTDPSDLSFSADNPFIDVGVGDVGHSAGFNSKVGAPWLGVVLEKTFTDPDELAFIETSSELRQLYRFDADSNLSFKAVVGTIAAAAIIAAIATLMGPLIAIETVAAIVVVYISGVLGVDIGTTSSATSFANPQAFRVAALYDTPYAPSLAPAVVNEAMRDNYGPLADYLTVGNMQSERQIVSAYTIFSYEAYGFTPNSDVLVEFGLPGEESLITDFVQVDENGVIRGTIEMPPPDVPLGYYLLSAVDAASLDYSLGQIIAGKSTQITGYATGTLIEVVEDVTPPEITIISPEARSHTRCEMPAVNFTVTDDLSGVDWTTALLDGEMVENGDPVDMLFWNLGDHSLVVDAADKVGNQAQEDVIFQLEATIAGMQCALDRFYENGLVDGHGTHNSLSKQLDAAQSALDRGQTRSTSNILSAFQNHVRAQTGKKIDPAAAAIFNMDSNALIDAYLGR